LGIYLGRLHKHRASQASSTSILDNILQLSCHRRQHSYGVENSSAAGERLIFINWLCTNILQRFAPAATGAIVVGVALFPKTMLQAESVEDPSVSSYFSIEYRASTDRYIAQKTDL
jgi:hypothetical protein